MLSAKIRLKEKVWLYPGAAAWYFVSVPKSKSATLKKAFLGLTAGFGSLPVTATIGQTTWKTSIFPESKSGCYMLPLKASVRKKENIAPKKIVSVTLIIEL